MVFSRGTERALLSSRRRRRGSGGADAVDFCSLRAAPSLAIGAPTSPEFRRRDVQEVAGARCFCRGWRHQRSAGARLLWRWARGGWEVDLAGFPRRGRWGAVDLDPAAFWGFPRPTSHKDEDLVVRGEAFNRFTKPWCEKALLDLGFAASCLLLRPAFRRRRWQAMGGGVCGIEDPRDLFSISFFFWVLCVVVPVQLFSL